MVAPMLLTGQWWERLGEVVFLPAAANPNDDPMYQGWVRVTEQRAAELLKSQPKG